MPNSHIKKFRLDEVSACASPANPASLMRLQKNDETLEKAQADLAKAQEEITTLKAQLEEQGKVLKSFREGKDADVVYTARSGRRFFKTDDADLVQMAKAHDAVLAKDEERAINDLAKELNCLPGEHDVRKSMVEAAYRADATAEGEDTPAMDALRKHNSLFANLYKVHGIDEDTSAPAGSFAEYVEKLRAEDENLTESAAIAKAVQTPEGSRLYAKEAGLAA